MSFFDKLKQKVQSIGEGSEKVLEVTFTKDTLGMSLRPAADGRAVVSQVTQGGEAATAGVGAGDMVISFNGSINPSYDDIIAVVAAIGRPLVVKFRRGPGAGTVAAAAAPAAAPAQPAGPSIVDKAAEAFKRAQGSAKVKMQEQRRAAAAARAPPPPAMTEEEKAERRATALAAAETRNKQWDQRLQKGRQATSARTAEKGIDRTFEPSTNEETRRIFELAKQAEAETAQKLGYNPYEARMTGHTEARAAVTGQTPPPGSLHALPQPSPPTAGGVTGGNNGHQYAGGDGGGEGERAAAAEEEEWLGQEEAMAGAAEVELEDALGVLMVQDHTVTLTAVATMLKMLNNMVANAEQDKFKRVRLANNAFRTKVGSVAGGMEVMVASGFVLHSDEEEAYLQYGSCSPVPVRLKLALGKLQQVEKLLSESRAKTEPSGVATQGTLA